jgi:hypothetical protein
MPRALQKFAHDQTRDDSRYPGKWWGHAIECSLHTGNVAVALSWVEVARAEILRSHPLMVPLNWSDTHRMETHANARGDIAFERVMREGTQEAREEFTEAMLEQHIVSRLSADATHLIAVVRS